MLRVVLTMDCDMCRKSFWMAAVCNDPEPFFWESFASDLQGCAIDRNWRVAEEIGGEMICDECVEKLEEETEEDVA